MKKPVIILLLLFFFIGTHAQRMSPEDYVNTYKNVAISEMKRSGIPASVTLAQGILETESGNSELVKKSNNHFGIKCKSTWTGESVTHTDDAPNECFRKYKEAADSYKDHSDYLKTSARYASLFLLAPSDYKGWAYGLKKAGYATNPRYPQILITNIEKYNLQQYDTVTDAQLFDDAVVVNKNNEEKAVSMAPVITEHPNADNNIKGKTTVNGLKALFAKKGTSLLAIATEEDIPLTKLLEYNDLITDGLLGDDQYIYLEKKAKQGNRDFYIALQDETFYDVAQNNGIQLKALQELNNVQGNELIKKGRKIKLRQTQQLTVSK